MDNFHIYWIAFLSVFIFVGIIFVGILLCVYTNKYLEWMSRRYEEAYAKSQYQFHKKQAERFKTRLMWRLTKGLGIYFIAFGIAAIAFIWFVNSTNP